MRHEPIIFVMPSLRMGGGNRVFIDRARELGGRQAVTLVAPATVTGKDTFSLPSNVGMRRVGFARRGALVHAVNLALLWLFSVRAGREAIVIVSDPILA